MKNWETVDLYTKALIAKYLNDNGHKSTLELFLGDCGLSMSDVKDVGQTFDENLETIVSERVAYAEGNKDLVNKIRLEEKALPIDAETPSWNHDAKFEPVPLDVDKKALIIGANFCNPQDSLLLSFADKTKWFYGPQWDLKDKNFGSEFNLGAVRFCGAVRSCVREPHDTFYMCTLDGTFHFWSQYEKGSHKLHQRLITHLQFLKAPGEDTLYIVSCGMDNCLNVHEWNPRIHQSIKLLSAEKLQSSCTSLQVASDGYRPLIFISRADYTHLLCFALENRTHSMRLVYKIALNNAQFSTHSFNVRDMAFIGEHDSIGTPVVTNSSVLLIATSHIPYMRLLVVKIPPEIAGDKDTVFYDKVLRNMPTEIEQDSYSEPILKTLPEGNGVLVGDSKGLYALDILNGDSWLLDLPGFSQGSRVKCMDINKSGTKLVLGLADKTVRAYNIVL
ncbi:uncharacterized protein TDEL_0F03510 [Torulaspora delbrueckii]|uniref:LisH domain-containing protein n=1 Tax=Torulaspora delbrueckii TaxID=4950 RepID=G8ZX18_TORDE|nr:hypothetical protein TDEL_0F03510 [Torulaspora delbrueckii]CCE93162.1 hypothetical protein TDEL_0F03510 [Torulaspora delbrueckii]